MSNNYTVHPGTIPLSKLLGHRASLSPSDYRHVLTPKKTIKLSSLLSKKPIKGREIGSDAYMDKSPYRFLKTVNISQSCLLDESRVEYCKPMQNAVKPRPNAILIVKDGGAQGLGECAFYVPKKGVVDFISAGVLQIEIADETERNYVFGILKSSHFRQYLDGVTPGGSTIRHAKMLAVDYEVPWSDDLSMRVRLAELVANVVDKERRILELNISVDSAISKELNRGLLNGTAKKLYPTKSELLETTRIDAGIYTELVRETDYLVTNYENGYYHIPERFTANRGQNLQVTAIGDSFYSNTPKPNFYRLFTNVEMTDLRTITGFRWLGNKKQLKVLPKNCVLLAADGMIVGRSFFFDELLNTITNIHPWVIAAKEKSLPRFKTVFLSLFLSYLKNIGYLEKIKDKSNGGGLKKNHVEKWIKIPDFPDDLQEKIASFYYSGSTSLGSKVSLQEQKERNAKLGIFQLNMEILDLRKEWDTLVHEIILNG